MTWPAIDHGILSPSGRVSERSRKAALKRETERLFGTPEADHSEPTYANQLYQARKLMNEQGRDALENPHAMIGRTCGCGTCYCCAAVQVLEESTLHVGQAVMVKWTNCNRCYEGKGEIVKVNAKTVNVSLTEHVDSKIGYAGYPAGQLIKVPINGTADNCVVI